MKVDGLVDPLVCQIRDLEASVEISSGGKDATLAEMRSILKGSPPLSLLAPAFILRHQSGSHGRESYITWTPPQLERFHW